MGVTREREGRTAFDDFSTPMCWVVSENDWVMVFRAFRGFLQVATSNDVMDAHGLILAADEGNERDPSPRPPEGGSRFENGKITMGIGADGAESGIRLIIVLREDWAVVVEEKFPAEFFFLHTLEVGDLIGTLLVGKRTIIREIVMVTHNAHHSIRRLELTEDRNERLELAFIKRDEIASKDDGIRLEGVYLINDTEKLVLMPYPTIKVEIRNLNNAEAVVGLRKPLASDCDRLYLMEIPAEEIAPAEENEPQAYQAESGIAKRLIGNVEMSNEGYYLCYKINQMWE